MKAIANSLGMSEDTIDEMNASIVPSHDTPPIKNEIATADVEIELDTAAILRETDLDLNDVAKSALTLAMQIQDKLFDYDPKFQGDMAERVAQLFASASSAMKQRQTAAQNEKKIALDKMKAINAANKGGNSPSTQNNNFFIGDRNEILKKLRDVRETINNKNDIIDDDNDHGEIIDAKL